MFPNAHLLFYIGILIIAGKSDETRKTAIFACGSEEKLLLAQWVFTKNTCSQGAARQTEAKSHGAQSEALSMARNSNRNGEGWGEEVLREIFGEILRDLCTGADAPAGRGSGGRRFEIFC